MDRFETTRSRRKKQSVRKRQISNRARGRNSFLEQIRELNRHAAGVANQYSTAPSLRHIHASLAETTEYAQFMLSAPQRAMRWLLALSMIPMCLISTQALIDVISAVSEDRYFWFSAEFWLFSTGAFLMLFWFFSRIKQNVFLYLYVLGHELTHAIFAMCHFGRISEFKASSDGGYIATDKNNVLISLSPYFFPFWSVMIIGIYGPMSYFVDLPEKSEHVLYLLTGFTWTFHTIWTIWMIPRDQPDLRDNDTFFSLTLIYLANVLVLSMLICLAVDDLSIKNYADVWWYHAEKLFFIIRDAAIQYWG